MINQETQLELDFGILTVAQQECVDSFIKRKKELVFNYVKNSNAIETLLNEGGFIKGIDFENTIKIKIVTDEVELGYNETAFKTTATYKTVDGNVSILYKKYDSRENKIVNCICYVSRNSDKLECSFTPQYRAYKPKSLYEKLLENNSNAQNKYNSVNREKAVINYTVEKYKTLFPKAEVTVGKDYYKNYYKSNKSNYIYFPIITVKFEKGSYISFSLGYENDKETVYKKYNAVEFQLSAIELLNIFNQQ